MNKLFSNLEKCKIYCFVINILSIVCILKELARKKKREKKNWLLLNFWKSVHFEGIMYGISLCLILKLKILFTEVLYCAKKVISENNQPAKY